MQTDKLLIFNGGAALHSSSSFSFPPTISPLTTTIMATDDPSAQLLAELFASQLRLAPCPSPLSFQPPSNTSSALASPTSQTAQYQMTMSEYTAHLSAQEQDRGPGTVWWRQMELEREHREWEERQRQRALAAEAARRAQMDEDVEMS